MQRVGLHAVGRCDVGQPKMRRRGRAGECLAGHHLRTSAGTGMPTAAGGLVAMTAGWALPSLALAAHAQPPFALHRGPDPTPTPTPAPTHRGRLQLLLPRDLQCLNHLPQRNLVLRNYRGGGPAAWRRKAGREGCKRGRGAGGGAGGEGEGGEGRGLAGRSCWRPEARCRGGATALRAPLVCNTHTALCMLPHKVPEQGGDPPPRHDPAAFSIMMHASGCPGS